LSPYTEIDQRLQRLRMLWRELQQTPRKSAKYAELEKQIREESDAYNALLDTQQKKEQSGD
jgi:hypothetical protein